MPELSAAQSTIWQVLELQGELHASRAQAEAQQQTTESLLEAKDEEVGCDVMWEETGCGDGGFELSLLNNCLIVLGR
jgi:hypothetical protein